MKLNFYQQTNFNCKPYNYLYKKIQYNYFIKYIE